MKTYCQDQVNLAVIKDIKSFTRFYQVLPLDDVAPPLPTTSDPPEPWMDSEPGFDGTSKALFYTDRTIYSDGSFSYSPICRSANNDAIIQLAQNLQGTNSDLDSLKDTVRQASESITEKSDEIMSIVADTYTSKTDTEQLKEQLQTSITQSSSDIRMDFSDSVTMLNNQIEANQNNLEKYIRFVDGTIELGEMDNAFKAELSNTDLAFLQDGAAVAYISDNAMKITDAQINRKLSLGQSEKGWFDFIPRENGNLSLKWRDS